MKKLMISATIMLLSAMNVMAQDKLTIDDFSIQAGETKSVAINLINEKAYAAVQFDLVLPTGLSIAKKANGKFNVSLSATRCDFSDPSDPSHVMTVTEVSTGLYRFVAYSNSNIEFTGNSGALITINVAAASDISAGDLNGTIKDAVITPKTGTDTKPADFTFKVTATAASGINEISIDNPADVYDLQGNKVRSNATSTDGLSKGVYIINGQKVIVK